VDGVAAVDGVVIDGIGVLATAIGAEMAVGGTEAAADAAGRCGDLAFFVSLRTGDADDSSGAFFSAGGFPLAPTVVSAFRGSRWWSLPGSCSC
jgi:hypothetical protein